MPTLYLPAERDPAAAIAAQRGLFAPDAFATTLLSAIPLPLIVLNVRRQIVHANAAAEVLAGGAPEALFGLRPGEALGCRHAHDCAGGCGTGKHCRVCGLVAAAVAGCEGREAVSECRLDAAIDGVSRPLDLRVWARPLVRHGSNFSVVVLADIGHEKRREALEQAFFHDLMNSVGSLSAFLNLLQAGELAANDETLALLRLTARQALEEIAGQRTLLAAERGELQVDWQVLDAGELLRQTCAIYRGHRAVAGRSLLLAESLAELPLISDPALLRRCLGNLLLNACEAGTVDEAVTLGCYGTGGDGVVFTVHNVASMPREVQLQIFQRSFSTKGAGRGLGTYSIRLLAGYLQGTVDFTSTPEAGTTFRLLLPTVPPSASSPRSAPGAALPDRGGGVPPWSTTPAR